MEEVLAGAIVSAVMLGAGIYIITKIVEMVRVTLQVRRLQRHFDARIAQFREQAAEPRQPDRRS